MALRPCLVCGTPANGPRCPTHRIRTPHAQAKVHNQGLDRTHAKLAKHAIQDWVKTHGWVCPGWGIPAHPVEPGKLTGDHRIPRSVAPELAHDPTNYGVLCRPCNARKGGANRLPRR